MKNLFFIISLFILLSGCKKSSDSSPSSGNLLVKYEIISTTDISSGNGAFIGYYNGTGQYETTNEFKSGKVWSKTISVTETRRPLLLGFEATIPLSNPPSNTSIKGNLYVNNVLKATATNPATALGGAAVIYYSLDR